MRVFGTVALRAALLQVTVACGVSISLCERACAEDYLPLLSSVTGREIARSYRSDGKPPAKELGDADKRACFLDENEVPNRVGDKISALMKTDREAAGIEAIKAIIPCMKKKGWRTELVAKGIDPSLFPVIDAALSSATSSLPRELDIMSDLTAIKRVNEEIVYTIKVKADFQSDADMLRRLYDSNPVEAKTSAMNIMKKTLCMPQPNRFLTTGFTVVYETFDARGLLSTQKLVAANC
jgi:hypothetical protein